MQTLSDIKSLLDGFGLRPKHRLGQNFLHDANKMDSVIDAADIRDGDVVLEVGPGTGALSLRLLDVGATVIAVEIDEELEPILQLQFQQYADRVSLIIGDALQGKRHLNPAIIEALRAVGEGEIPQFKVVANLPYQIASPLIANLVTGYPQMSTAVVMIQREVADRLVAAPGGKDYGPLGIVVQVMCQVERVATLSPGCFWPAPQVDSAVVRLTRRQQPLTDDPQKFSETLQLLFGKRRKQIGSILGRNQKLPDGIKAESRPETLTVEQLVAIDGCLEQ